MNKMEKDVICLIEKLYDCKYGGGIEVTQLGSGGYILKLDLGNTGIRSIQIAANLNAEDFLEYVKKELISRQLSKVQFSRGIKIYPEDEERRTY